MLVERMNDKVEKEGGRVSWRKNRFPEGVWLIF